MTTTAATHSRQAPGSPGHDVADPLSAEPEKRAVELAFLHRLNQAAGAAAANVLGTTAAGRDAFAQDLAFVRSPVFARMARILEKSVAWDADFGTFRGR